MTLGLSAGTKKEMSDHSSRVLSLGSIRLRAYSWSSFSILGKFLKQADESLVLASITSARIGFRAWLLRGLSDYITPSSSDMLIRLLS